MTRLVLVGIAAASIVGNPVLAQPPQSKSQPAAVPAAGGSQAGQPGQPGQAGQPGTMKPRNTGPIISVKFDGGSVGDYVSTVIAAAAPTPINVIMPPEARPVTMAGLTLRNVSVETALESISYAFSRSGDDQFGVNQIGSGSTDEGEALTFVLRYQKSQRQVQQTMMMQPRTSMVHSIRTLVEMPDGSAGGEGQTVPIDNILNALRIGAELEQKEGDSAPPEFMLHKDSLLLICRGTPDQHRMVEQVLGELGNGVDQRRATAQRMHSDAMAAEAQAMAMETEFQKASGQVQVADAELGAVRAQRDAMAKAMEGGTATAVEVERAAADYAVAETNLATAISYRDMVRQRLDQVKRQGAAGGGARGAGAIDLGARTAVIYDVRDLKDYRGDLLQMCDLVVRKSADKDYSRVEVKPASGDSTGSIVVKGTADQHRILVHFFNAARRLKTGEPKLPGLNADDVIKNSAKE